MRFKAVFINGSPRKGWNTHQMLMKAADGAKDAGADVQEFDLYDLNFTGCRSCFAASVKNCSQKVSIESPIMIRRPVVQGFL